MSGPIQANDPRIEQILNVILQLAAGNLTARATPSSDADSLDAVITGLNMLAEELAATMDEREAAQQALERSRSELEHRVLERTQALSEKTRRLERINDELQQFTYVVSHDLKAPLRAISNLVTWLEEDLGPHLGADNRKKMDLLRMRVQRMHKLVDALLEYSRAGSAAGALEPVDCGALVSDVVHSYSMPSRFKVNISPALPRFMAQRLQLRQVFANLISNAIKHHDREDGQVWIDVEEAGNYYVFSVRDNGPGIDRRYHQKIFEMFQTLTARDKSEHTGIGLALVKKLVVEAGGEITVQSGSGRGATFRFTWPKVAAGS